MQFPMDSLPPAPLPQRWTLRKQALSGVTFGIGVGIFLVWFTRIALYGDCWTDKAIADGSCSGLALLLQRTIHGCAAFAVFTTITLLSDCFAASSIIRTPERCSPQPAEVVAWLQNGSAAPRKNIVDEPRGNVYCVRCLCWRGPSAHHCSLCGRCVEEWDHHCFALGTCIGGSTLGLRGNMLLFRCHMLNAAVALVTMLSAWARYLLIRGAVYNPREMPSAAVFFFRMLDGRGFFGGLSLGLMCLFGPLIVLTAAFACVNYTWNGLFIRANVRPAKPRADKAA